MASGRPLRSYRTARERVALRRGNGSPRNIQPHRSGCGTIIVGLVIILVLSGIVASALTHHAARTLEAIEKRDPRRSQADSANSSDLAGAKLPDILQDPFNVLLAGVDQRGDDNDGIRSDTLIVVHVNPRDGWAGMLSIPRDSVVQIPRLGQQKINTAYSYGYLNAANLYGSGTDPAAAGGAFAAETVENFLGLHIDYIAQIDFRGFERVVDTLGGITVDVPKPLIDAEYPTENYGYERIYVPAGLQVLNGHTALRYARSRHSSSDFERSHRQQQILRAILTEVRHRGIFDQATLLPELVNDLEHSVATTLPISDLSVLHGLVRLARTLTPDRILQLSINPNDVAVIAENGSDIYWNQEDISLLVTRLMAGPSGNAETARIQIQNGAGIQGLATRVTTNLTAQGFLMTPAVDAPSFSQHTRIIDYTNQPATRRRLAQLLGVDPRYIEATPAVDTPPAPYDTDIVVVLGQDYQEHRFGTP